MDTKVTFPAGPMISAVFCQNLEPKYLRPHQHPERPKRSWDVLGKFDYLSFLELDSLSQLASSAPAEFPIASPDSLCDFRTDVLFPLRQQDRVDWRLLTQPQDAAYTILVYNRYHFALPAIHAPRSVDSPLGQIGAVTSLLAQHAQSQLEDMKRQLATEIRYKLLFFGSLGSADFVSIFLTDSPEGLHLSDLLLEFSRSCVLLNNATNDAASSTRRRKLPSVASFAELSLTIRKNRDLPDLCDDSRFYGHTFSAIDSTTAFALTSQFRNKVKSQDFRSRERAALGTFTYEMRIAVECGHEQFLMHQLRSRTLRTDPETFDVSERLRMAARGVHIHCSHLADVLDVMEDMTESPSYAGLHILDSITIRSTSPKLGAVEQSHLCWLLNPDILQELELIKTSIDDCGRLLTAQQLQELKSVFEFFKLCFHRGKLISTACDLLPVFRYLTFLIKAVAAPATNSLPPEATQNKPFFQKRLFTSENLTPFFAHLQRALTNRSEHLGIASDPPSPSTITNGCYKTVRAYTAIIRKCVDMFCSSGEEQGLYLSQRSAHERVPLVVYIGTRGIASFEVVLEEPHQLLQQEKFPVPITMLDVSGTTLLKPSLLVAHALHEVAESCAWIERSTAETLRHRINRSILYFIGVETMRTLNGGEETFVNAVQMIANIVYAAGSKTWSTFGETESSKAAFEYILRALVPTDNPQHFCRRLAAAIDSTPSIASFPLAETDYALMLVIKTTIRERIEDIEKMLREILADIGMVCGLCHLVFREPILDAEAQNESSTDVQDVLGASSDEHEMPRAGIGVESIAVALGRFYRSAIEMCVEANSTDSAKLQILRRWCVAAYVFCGENYLPEIIEEAKSRATALDPECIRGVEDFVNCFSPKASPKYFSGILAKFMRGHVGKIEELIDFPEVGARDSLVSAIAKCWADPKNNAYAVEILMKGWLLSVNSLKEPLIIPAQSASS